MYIQGEQNKNENCKLLKRAYRMLSVPCVIAAIILLVLSAGIIYYGAIGVSDFNGGGWLLFLIFVVLFSFFPTIIANIFQVLFWFMGRKKLKKEDQREAWIYAMVCAVSVIVGNAYMVFGGLDIFFNDESQNKVYFWGAISVAFIIYGIVIVGILLKEKIDKSSSEC